MSLLQHLIGLTHARSGADIDFEPAALGALDQLKEIFGTFAVQCHQEVSLIVNGLITRRLFHDSATESAFSPPTPHCHQTPHSLHQTEPPSALQKPISRSQRASERKGKNKPRAVLFRRLTYQ